VLKYMAYVISPSIKIPETMEQIPAWKAEVETLYPYIKDLTDAAVVLNNNKPANIQ